MYVCICKQITDKEIEAAVADGHTELEALSSHLGLGMNCGNCRGYTNQILAEMTGVSSPIVYGN
jgi:bacterioferritin-associated ferredoxin